MLILVLCSFCITIRFAHSNDEKCLQNKVAVVTGAAQGIGYAITENMLKAGAKSVIMLDIQYEKGMEAATKLNNKYGGNRASFIYCDVTMNLEDVSYRIFNEFPYIDILVNNAGVLDEYSSEATINTNSLAVIQWSLKFWHHMRRDRDGRGGTIINISSIFGYYVQPFAPIYIASKYAVLGYSKSLGHEYTYRNTRVRVLTICPGYTYTAMVMQPLKVMPEQLEDLIKLYNAIEKQTADDVGRGTVKVFETAESGTAWEISGGNDPVEAPARVTLTAAYIDSLP